MTIVAIQRTERLVTKGELSKQESKLVSTMIKVGNSLGDIKKYLEKQGHTVIEEDKTEDMDILFFSTKEFTEEDIKNLLKSLGNI